MAAHQWAPPDQRLRQWRSVAQVARLTAVALSLSTLALTLTMAVRQGDGDLDNSWVLAVFVALGTCAVPIGRWAPLSAPVFLLSAAVLGFHVVLPVTVAQVNSATDATLRHVDDQLLGAGNPSLIRAVATVLSLLTAAAVLFCFGAAPGRPTAGALVVAACVAVLAGGIAVVGGAGLARFGSHFAINEVEFTAKGEPTRGAKPVVLGHAGGWSRSGVSLAVPAGDVVVARDVTARIGGSSLSPTTAILGLRAADGARLWSYGVDTGPDQQLLGATVVDPVARVTLVMIGRAAVGLRMDGSVAYRRDVGEPDVLGKWTPVSDTLGRSAPMLTTGAVAVLSDVAGGSPTGNVMGIEVATGTILWERTSRASSVCELAATQPDRWVSPGSTTVFLVTGGSAACRPSIARYDGAVHRWDNPLEPPAGMTEARATHAVAVFGETPPTVAAPSAGRAFMSVVWTGRRDGTTRAATLLTQIADDGTQTLIDDDPSAGRLPGRVGLPVATGTDPRAPLAVRRYVSARGNAGTFWTEYDDAFTTASEVVLPGRVILEPSGSLVVTYPDEGRSGVVELRSRTDHLRVLDSFTPSDTTWCPTGILEARADANTLVFPCGEYVVVRPVPQP